MGANSNGDISAKFTAKSFNNDIEELFVLDNVDCQNEIVQTWRIPNLTPFLESIAMGTIHIEFMSGDTIVGCSNVPVARGTVAVAKTAALATAGIGSAFFGGYFLYKFLYNHNIGANGFGMTTSTTTSSTNF